MRTLAALLAAVLLVGAVGCYRPAAPCWRPAFRPYHRPYYPVYPHHPYHPWPYAPHRPYWTPPTGDAP